MKSRFFSIPCTAILIFLIGQSSHSAIVNRSLTLAQIASERPEQLRGNGSNIEVFFPLPVRQFLTTESTLELTYHTSANIPPGSHLEVEIRGFLMDPVPLRDENDVTSSIVIPLARLSEKLLTEDFLDVRLTLRIPPDHADDGTTYWVEIDPASRANIHFDNQNPDWTAVNRLPVTLSPVCDIPVVAPQNALLAHLLLKVNGWIAFVRPLATFSTPEPGISSPSGIDTFRLVDTPPGTGSPLISVQVGEGCNRSITLEVSAEIDVRTLWQSLRATKMMPLPGREWSVAQVTGDDADKPRPRALRVESLGGNFFDPWQGSGDSNRTFEIDMARFGPAKQDLHLEFTAIHSPVAAASGGGMVVTLNQLFLAVIPLTPGKDRTDAIVEIPYYLLEPQNRLAVRLRSPSNSDPSSQIFQILPGAILSSDPAGGEYIPSSLVEAARRYFSRGSYLIVMEDENSDFLAACAMVRWLQRMNPSTLLEPQVIDAASAERESPIVFVGNSPPPELQLGAMPVALDAGMIFRFPDEDLNIRFEPAQSFGIWQLLTRGRKAPSIVMSKSGPQGTEALMAMSNYAADLPWIGFGDVLVGDAISTPREMLTTGISSVGVEAIAAPWYRDIRKWALIVLWTGFSAIVFFVLQRTRRTREL